MRCAWTEYAIANAPVQRRLNGALYLIERTQKWLPFNPQKFPNVEPGLAFVLPHRLQRIRIGKPIAANPL